MYRYTGYAVVIVGLQVKGFFVGFYPARMRSKGNVIGLYICRCLLRTCT